MISYWEKQSFTNYQYIIVGGGLVGLSTALSLRKLDPSASILILERGVFPSGASTRNAGFACFGSLTELLDDFNTMGESEAVALVSDRWRGLKRLRERVGDKQLGYQNHGGFELLFSEDIEALDSMDRVNDLLQAIFGQKVYSVKPELIEDFGFNRQRVKQLVVNPFEGQVHTGSMMKSLIDLAKEQGIDYLTGATVTNFESTSLGVTLNVSSLEPEIIGFAAQRLAICTNAFTDQLIPGLDLRPGRGLVLITEPIENLKLQGVFHYHHGYYYFRNVGSRVLFGGGRNLDIDAEATIETGTNPVISGHLKEELSQLILPGQKFKIDGEWSGIMAFGKDKRPPCWNA